MVVFIVHASYEMLTNIARRNLRLSEKHHAAWD